MRITRPVQWWWLSFGLVVVGGMAWGANLFAAEPPPAASETPRMRGLGVGTHFGRNANWDVDKVLPLVKQMGVSVIRDGPEWAGIEKTKGGYAIQPHSQHWFDMVTKSGIRVILPLFRKNSIYENPLDPEAFARYAAFMAQTWKQPEICAYEIWNEPPNFDFPQQYKGKGHSWKPQYSEMVRKAAAAIRAVNPKAVIIHNLECSAWLEEVKARPENYALVDGIDLHPYPTRYPAETSPWNPPITGPDRSMVSYLTVQARDYPKKYLHRELDMYVGEYGYPTMQGGKGQWQGITDEAQAAYHVRGLLTGLHAGVKVWCLYDMVNEGTTPDNNEDNMGLVRDRTHNYEPKLAFYAIQRVARLMGPDWQLAGEISAKLNVNLPPEAEDKHVQVTGPQALWFRVGADYLTFVWKAGYFTDGTGPLGEIVWTKAGTVAAVEAQNLVTGKPVETKLSRAGDRVTLTGVPVGSSPVAIRWIAGQ